VLEYTTQTEGVGVVENYSVADPQTKQSYMAGSNRTDLADNIELPENKFNISRITKRNTFKPQADNGPAGTRRMPPDPQLSSQIRKSLQRGDSLEKRGQSPSNFMQLRRPAK